MGQPLHVKYRPQNIEELQGNADIRASLNSLLSHDDRPHAYLFSGPTGCGKSTLARITARELNCDEQNTLEIDAATHAGIDNIRNLIHSVQYKPFGSNQNRAVIIDEAHAISKGAWQTFLKSIEEPPEHVFWIFCTTEEEKVPASIKNRCVHYQVTRLSDDQIIDLLFSVLEQEQMEVSDEALEMISVSASGCPRQALVYLDMCRGVDSSEAVARLIRSTEDSSDPIQLCRLLAKPKPNFKNVAKIVKSLNNQDPEPVRRLVFNYFTTVLLNSRGDLPDNKALTVLEAFSRPYPAGSTYGMLLVSIGEVYRELYGE